MIPTAMSAVFRDMLNPAIRVGYRGTRPANPAAVPCQLEMERLIGTVPFV